MRKTIEVEIKGTHPLLVHGTDGLDPTNELKKQAAGITAKRGNKRTDSDLAKLDWIDFQLALYHNEEVGPYVPDSWIFGAIHEGAKSKRRGNELLAGMEVKESIIPLIYDGPREVKALYDEKFLDRRAVGIQQSRVMRTRPKFNDWRLRFHLCIEDSVLDVADVKEYAEYAGERKGIGDFRPRFGRFELTKWKESKEAS